MASNNELNVAVSKIVRKWDLSLDEAIGVVCHNPNNLARFMRQAFMYLLGSLAALTRRSKPNRTIVGRTKHTRDVEYFTRGGQRKVLEKVWLTKINKILPVKNRGLAKKSWFWNFRGRGDQMPPLKDAPPPNELSAGFSRKGGWMTYLNKLPYIDKLVKNPQIREAEKNAARRYLYNKLRSAAAREIKKAVNKEQPTQIVKIQLF